MRWRRDRRGGPSGRGSRATGGLTPRTPRRGAGPGGAGGGRPPGLRPPGRRVAGRDDTRPLGARGAAGSVVAIVEQVQLGWGGGVEARAPPQRPALVHAAEVVDVLDNRGEAVVRHLLADLPRIEAQQLPAGGLQIVVAEVVPRD